MRADQSRCKAPAQRRTRRNSIWHGKGLRPTNRPSGASATQPAKPHTLGCRHLLPITGGHSRPLALLCLGAVRSAPFWGT
eukprot:scaffold4475_cov114-Isochrysis_galbana.AAC.7